MEIIQLLKKTAKEQTDVMVVTGVCEKDAESLKVFPKPGNTSVMLDFRLADIVEGPLEFESNTEPYSRPDVMAVKVRKGSIFRLTNNGATNEMELTPKSAQDPQLFALASATASRTYCVGLLEFECGTNKLLGPCIFGWDCD